jgi:hypothetical protein
MPYRDAEVEAREVLTSMSILGWLFHGKTAVTSAPQSQGRPSAHEVISRPKTEFVDIPSRNFFGESIKSPDGQFTLAWRDANDAGTRGGSRTEGKGKYLALRGKDVIAQGAIARPNDGKIADNGNFILNDWGFGGELQGGFLAFDRTGKALVRRRFEANLFNNGLSADGGTAVCQTANAYDGEDGSKLTIFNLRTGVEVASWIPTSGWADFYGFPSEGVIQLGYSRLGVFSFRWDGEFLDKEKWQEAQLTRGDYSTVMIAVESALENSSDGLDPTRLGHLLASLDRISKEIPASDIKRKALLRKLEGQCAELRGELRTALAAYDAALAIDQKVGIKRRADQIRKQLIRAD